MYTFFRAKKRTFWRPFFHRKFGAALFLQIQP